MSVVFKKMQKSKQHMCIVQNNDEVLGGYFREVSR